MEIIDVLLDAKNKLISIKNASINEAIAGVRSNEIAKKNAEIENAANLAIGEFTKKYNADVNMVKETANAKKISYAREMEEMAKTKVEANFENALRTLEEQINSVKPQA